MQKSPSRITNILIIPIGAAIFFMAVAAMARHAHHQFEQNLITLTEQQLLMTAKAAGKSLERHITDHINSLTEIASDPLFKKPLTVITEASSEYQRLLIFYNAHQEELQSVALLDARGKTLARYPRGEDGRKQQQEGAGAEPIVAEILKGHPPQVSRSFVNQRGEKVVTLAVPIWANQDDLTGVIMATVGIDTLIALYIQPLKQGGGAFPVLIDENGEFLSHPEQKTDAPPSQCGFNGGPSPCSPNDCPTMASIQGQIAQGQAGVGLFRVAEENPRGGTRFIAYAPIHLPGRVWAMGVVRPFNAIADPIRRHSRMALVLVLIVLLFLGIGGTLLFRSHGKRHALEIEKRYLQEIAAKARELERVNQILQEQAVKDELTGLYNYRYFHKVLQRDFALAERAMADYSCMIVDLDHFKQVNDSHGHAFGDFVLKGIGRVLQEECRDTDVVARYGGEEFVILLPDTDLAGCLVIAERIRARLASHVYADGSHSKRVTASIGVASFAAHQPESPQDLLAFADKALYQAKSEQRNRVVVYT